MNPKGFAVVNDFHMETATTLSGKEEYPENIIEKVKEKATTKVLNAAKIAGGFGKSESYETWYFWGL